MFYSSLLFHSCSHASFKKSESTSARCLKWMEEFVILQYTIYKYLDISIWENDPPLSRLQTTNSQNTFVCFLPSVLDSSVCEHEAGSLLPKVEKH